MLNSDVNDCPICGQGKIASEEHSEDFEYLGSFLVYQCTERYCDSCGSLLQTPEIIHQNSKNKNLAIEQYESNKE